MVTFFRSSRASLEKRRPLSLPPLPDGHLQKTAAPPNNRGPKPGKGPTSGSEPCEQPNCLPFQKLARSLEGMQNRRGEQRGAQVSPTDWPGPWRSKEVKSWSQRLPALSSLVLTLLGDGGHSKLRGSALSAIDHPNSFRYFLSHLLFKKNLMFSIIHPSQKIIDRARNENLSHIL